MVGFFFPPTLPIPPSPPLSPKSSYPIPTVPTVPTHVSPNTHPTNDHHPHLCTPMQPVELHRHSESRRLVSKMCNSETSQATSRSKKVRTPQTMGITGPLGKLYGLPLIAQKKYWENRCMSNIFRTFAKSSLKVLMVKIWGK